MVKEIPTNDEQFRHLCENGLSFVSKAIEQLWDNTSHESIKYSVINFYSGLELLIKARLMHEHWTLIVDDPNKADIDDFLNGDAQTVGLQKAVMRLKKTIKLSIPPAALASFEELRKHRNRMVHFHHPVNATKYSGDKQTETIVLEQCRGWFYLRRMLSDEWKDVFKDFQRQISRVNTSMKHHREYLGTVYAQILPELEEYGRNGAILAACSACGFKAQVLDEVGPQQKICRVCLANESFLIHTCPNEECQSKSSLPADGSEEWVCSHCKTSIDIEDVMSAYTLEGNSDYDDPRVPALCTECLQETAGTLNDTETIFCFNCFSWPAKIEHCGWCGEPFTGDAENTYWAGCERCSGLAGWTPDD